MPDTLTLRDIADLAGVARPVVSMWRKRPMARGQAMPFPAPVGTVGGIERFDRRSVVDYLDATGRGNNPEAALDAPGFSVPDLPVDTLVALLCLRTLHGDDIDGEDVRALAAQHDPADRVFRREVDEAAGVPTAYVDRLVSSSFGPSDALERLMASRAGRGADGSALTPPAVIVVSTLARELLAHLGLDFAELVDGSAGSSDVAVRVAAHLGRSVRVDGDEAAARRLRRHAVLRELQPPHELRERVVRLDSMLGLDAAEALRRLDDLQLGLRPGDLGLALGPASLLCDRVTDGERDQERDSVLRDRQLRVAVRLPRAMWRAAPRQALGLWVFVSGQEASRVAVADLSDRTVNELDADELALDVLAAVRNDHGHRYTMLLDRELSTILPTRSVVARGARALPAPGTTAAETTVAVDDLVARLNRPSTRVALAVGRARGAQPAPTTLGQLRERRLVRLLTGSRLDPTWARAAGTVAVASPEGRWDGVAFDPLDLEARAPRARRTEPGDVVFTAAPPAAVVDERGGHVVPVPARVLRLADDAPLGPRSLAAQINAQPASARDADGWHVAPTVDPGLEAGLDRLDAVRRDLAERLRALDALETRLVDAVGRGVVRIQTTPASEER